MHLAVDQPCSKRDLLKQQKRPTCMAVDQPCLGTVGGTGGMVSTTPAAVEQEQEEEKREVGKKKGLFKVKRWMRCHVTWCTSPVRGSAR